MIRKNNSSLTAICLAGVVFGMVGLSFAAVPLYRIFCQVTGFGGTPQIVEKGSLTILDRQITVRFNADRDRDLPWEFKPEQRSVRLKLGEQSLAFYRARNYGQKAITGTAIFNVTPEKAGQYFNKIECFCFTEQRLEAGQATDMPVTFYVDPRLNDDPSMADVTTITLSYTFYPAEDGSQPSAKTAQLSNPLPSHN